VGRILHEIGYLRDPGMESGFNLGRASP